MNQADGATFCSALFAAIDRSTSLSSWWATQSVSRN